MEGGTSKSLLASQSSIVSPTNEKYGLPPGLSESIQDSRLRGANRSGVVPDAEEYVEGVKEFNKIIESKFEIMLKNSTPSERMKKVVAKFDEVVDDSDRECKVKHKYQMDENIIY